MGARPMEQVAYSLVLQRTEHSAMLWWISLADLSLFLSLILALADGYLSHTYSSPSSVLAQGGKLDSAASLPWPAAVHVSACVWLAKGTIMNANETQQPRLISTAPFAEPAACLLAADISHPVVNGELITRG